MKCQYCGRRGDHDHLCPELLEGDAKVAAAARVKQGYDDGRARIEPRMPDDAHYMMGWPHGDAAADEAENSVPWVEV